MVGKIKKGESLLDKWLFKPIKSVLKVYLKDHISLLALHFEEMANLFLDNNGIF